MENEKDINKNTSNKYEIEPNGVITDYEIDENGIKIIKAMKLYSYNLVQYADNQNKIQ